MSSVTFLADVMPQLVTNDGNSTAIGVWVLMAIAAGAAALFIYNQILGIQLKKKQIDSPAVIQQQINPQPLIVAMEKEFVLRSNYDRDQEERRGHHAKELETVKERVETVAKYTGDRIHEFTKHLATIGEDSRKRGEMLAALDERTKNSDRMIKGLGEKVDRIVERVADKVEELLRNGGKRS